MYRYLKAMVRDEELARDLTQDTFLRAFRSLGGYRGDAQLATWMLAIARHVAFNRARRRRLEERWHVVTGALPEVPDPRSVADSRDPLLLDALAALPAAQREAVALYYLEDLDVDAVAHLTGRPANTVKSDLHRARAALRAVLGEPGTGMPASSREGSSE